MLHGVVSSDWHFDGLKSLFPTNHATMVANEVEKVYQYAVDNGIKYIFVPGDIADNYKISPESQRAILSILVKYDGLITTYYMMGNHDFGDVSTTSLDVFQSISEFSLLKTFHIVRQRKAIDIEGVTVNFCPFPYKTPMETKRPSINMIHANVAGAIGDNGKPLRVKEDVELAEGSFTFGGHIHKHQFLKKKATVLCGNLYQKNFGESGQKGFVEFKAKYADRKLKVKWNYVETRPNFMLETVHIKRQEDFGSLKANPKVKYRLYVAEGIIVPNKLKREIPNIEQIWEVRGKKVAFDDLESQFIQDTAELPKINPTVGLGQYMKKAGFSKKEYLEGKRLVEEVVNQLTA